MDLNGIENTISVLERRIADIPDTNVFMNMNSVSFVFGPTGSGKTTFCAYMTGKTIHVISASCDMPGISIEGLILVPSTIVPSIEHVNNNAYTDFPGYNDINGVDKEIENAFITHRFFSTMPNHIRKIKIFCLVSSSDCKSSRGIQIKKCFEYMEKMIPNLDDIKEHFALIITKCKDRRKGRICIMKLLENSKGIVQKWCRYFLDHFENQVFIFPKPSTDNIGQLFPQFEDYRRINAFTASNINNPIHHIDHCIALTDEANAKVKLIEVQQKTKCRRDVIEIFEGIKNSFINENSLDRLDSWLNLLIRISRYSRNTDTYQWISQLQREFSNHGFDYLFLRLINSQKINEFISEALGNENEENIQKYINDKMLFSVNQIIPTLKSDLFNKKLTAVAASLATVVVVAAVAVFA